MNTTPVPVTPASCCLEKHYGIWRLRFAGQDAWLKDCDALHYVLYCLQHPSAPAGCAQLYATLHPADASAAGCTPDRLASSPATPPTLHQEIVTRRPCRQLAAHLRTLRAEMAQLRETIEDPEKSPLELREAQAEYDLKLRQLRGLSHAPRHGAARAVDTVRHTVRRLALDLLAATTATGQPHETLRAFGAFIQRYILDPSRGYPHQLVCFPPPSLTWNSPPPPPLGSTFSELGSNLS